LKTKLLCAALVLAFAALVVACATPAPDDNMDTSNIPTVGVPEVLFALQDPDNWVIVDVRTQSEFEGNSYSNYSGLLLGRIAGAMHIEWSDALDETGQLLPEAQLREVYGEILDGRHIIVYCRSGVRSLHTWQVLHDLGASVFNFEGAWIEWSYAFREDSSFPYSDLVQSFTEGPMWG